MHCPRCGEEAREAERFCRSCGTDLELRADPAPSKRTLGQRLRRLAGQTRGERLLAAGTAIAIAIAIAAFIALPESEKDEPSQYVLAADPICVEAKRAIARAGSQALSADDAGVGGYADDLVRLVAQWRSDTRGLVPPAGARADAEALDVALREVLTGSAQLAAAARNGDGGGATAIAASLDESSVRVEEAIDALELERCNAIDLSRTPVAQ
jgi:hypothetical protein